MRKIFSVLLLFVLFIGSDLLFAEAIVIKKGSRANPTLVLAASSVDNDLKSFAELLEKAPGNRLLREI